VATARRRVGHAVVSIAMYAALGHVLHRMHQNLPLPPFVKVPYLFLHGQGIRPFPFPVELQF
jgi:hypothetical protein